MSRASHRSPKRRQPVPTTNNRCHSRYLRFEPLEDRRMLSLIGDAPAPYPAASVSADTGPVLGGLRTKDDGVLIDDFHVGQLEAQVTFSVANAGPGALLDGWIDFNRDGSFGGAFEQVFDAVDLPNGNTELTFEVPSWAQEGETYARFRLSQGTSAGLPQGGTAANGEVEDFLINIYSPFLGSGEFGTERSITNNGSANGVVDVLTIDIDQDGDMDVVSSSHIDGEIAIYRGNSTVNTWSRDIESHVTASNDPTVVNPVGLAAGDLDGDGDIDLVSASSIDDTIAWYRNDGGASSFSEIRFTTQADGARAVVVADLDRDGRLDLASLSFFDGTIRVHQNTGSTSASQLFDTDKAVVFPVGSFPADLYAADIDRDGWVDLVSITAMTNRVDWHRNDGTPFNGLWDLGENIFDGANGLTPQGSGVFAADLDGDSDLDVVATSFGEDRVDWFRNSNDGSTWSGRLSIAGSIDGANPPFVADIDGDADMDVLTPAYDADRVYFHRNNGSGAFSLGDSVVFDTPTNVAVADINRDGVLDIVAGSHDADRISWWENPRLLPEIVVTGNELTISDGDNSPRSDDGTDFGETVREGPTIEQTFAIENTGAGTLAIGSLSGPAGFTLVTAPVSFLTPGESTEFTVRLETANSGTRTGQISFTTNDSNENPFNFSIRGMVVLPEPQEARVTGNGFEIIDGDSTPTMKDGTDFGSVMQGGMAISRTFLVHNDGGVTLTLDELTVPSGYTITEPLNSSLAPGASDSFTVRLETSQFGTKDGMIRFANNDSNEDPYNFAVTGTVTAPEVTVLCNGLEIVDGDTSPSLDDCTDFGSVVQGRTPITRTFTVRNDGNVTLTLSGLTLPEGYAIGENLSPSLSPDKSDSFTVQIDTSTAGTKSGQISFTTNDPNENPFNFTITGVVTPLGDYNMDGLVNSEDYQVWRSSFGRTGPDLAADGNGDGVVDTVDYVVWRNNLGAGSTSNSTASGTAVLAQPTRESTINATNSAASEADPGVPVDVAPSLSGRANRLEHPDRIASPIGSKRLSARLAIEAAVSIDKNVDNDLLVLSRARSSRTMSSEMEPDAADRARHWDGAIEAVDVAVETLGDDNGNSWRLF
jgi:hypothetical protein